MTEVEYAIRNYLESLVRKVVDEVHTEKDAWADRERAEWCGL